VATYLESLKETKTKTITEVVKEKVTEMVKDEESGEEKEVTKEVSKKVSSEVSYQTTKLIEMIGSDDSLLETIASMNDKKDSYTLVVGEDLCMGIQIVKI